MLIIACLISSACLYTRIAKRKLVVPSRSSLLPMQSHSPTSVLPIGKSAIVLYVAHSSLSTRLTTQHHQGLILHNQVKTCSLVCTSISPRDHCSTALTMPKISKQTNTPVAPRTDHHLPPTTSLLTFWALILGTHARASFYPVPTRCSCTRGTRVYQPLESSPVHSCRRKAADFSPSRQRTAASIQIIKSPNHDVSRPTSLRQAFTPPTVTAREMAVVGHVQLTVLRAVPDGY
jgi:hypothetical protein